ncbi:OLC1v1020512C1 [Oldenlandia corymbosa var. corymbosa]|uniref:OLC1v1020512C1 n=1 Tax=Oldenlandia corymbosa var. corymbosa TaxID=529605 RepID=A0AAV1EGX0_OLDCO|nr:OLC1v1020512C1 [Oldenlandia corymbosa var. corymbosa]
MCTMIQAGKVTRRKGGNSRKYNPLTAEFPIARLDGPISAELIEMWEAKCSISQRQEPQVLSLYEKLRESLVQGGKQGFNAFSSSAENMDNGIDSEDAGGDLPDSDIPDNNEDAPEHDEDESNTHLNDGYTYEDPNSNKSLEDLCRSHLDSLLANLAETEKQTEMAARVSTWKQRIEENLEEQDSRPPFDIHEYGERVLEKLHTERHNGSSMAFNDVVKGQEKHDVARTFSALLQLVNNGDVELEKSGSRGEHICYTSENTFYVNLLRNKQQSDGLMPRITKKRANSQKGRAKDYNKQPAGKENIPVTIVSPSISTSSCRFSIKIGKPGVTSRCTPEGKKRRKSRFILRDEPV